jgi:hypothetical protein
VQLKDQRTVRNQSLVFRSSVRAPTVEEPLVPAAVVDGSRCCSSARAQASKAAATPMIVQRRVVIL